MQGTIVLLLQVPHNLRCTRSHTHTHCTHGTCGVLHCLLFCDQTRPNLRISLVGYHYAIEFPCGVLLFYCCKYPTTYGVRVHTVHMALVGYFIVFSFVTKPGQTLEFLLWGTIVLLLQVPHNLWRTRPHCTHGTCGVLHCLLFCDQTRPNLRISLVGYHCAIEFPCGVPLFYCCKYPTTYGVRVRTTAPWREIQEVNFNAIRGRIGLKHTHTHTDINVTTWKGGDRNHHIQLFF